jgi:hypothetical protein
VGVGWGERLPRQPAGAKRDRPGVGLSEQENISLASIFEMQAQSQGCLLPHVLHSPNRTR